MQCRRYGTCLKAGGCFQCCWARLYKALVRLCPMHFSWEKHQELSKTVAVAADRNQGQAMALMGIGLTLLIKDLLEYELQMSSLPSSKA